MTSTFWPACDLAGVDERLQGGAGRDRDHRGLLEGEVRRLAGELVLPRRGVLGERAPGRSRTPRRRRRTGSPPSRPRRPCRRRRCPGTGFFGRRNPKPRMRSRYGLPVIRCQVPRSRPAACTRTSTSLSAISGRAISREAQDVGRAVRVLDDRLHRAVVRLPRRLRGSSRCWSCVMVVSRSARCAVLSTGTVPYKVRKRQWPGENHGQQPDACTSQRDARPAQPGAGAARRRRGRRRRRARVADDPLAGRRARRQADVGLPPRREQGRDPRRHRRHRLRRDRAADDRRRLALGDAAASASAREVLRRHPWAIGAAGVAHQPRARRRCDTTTRSSAPCARRASRWR